MLFFTGNKIIIVDRISIGIRLASKKECRKPCILRIVILQPHGNGKRILMIKHPFWKCDIGRTACIASRKGCHAVRYGDTVTDNCVIAVSGGILPSVFEFIPCQQMDLPQSILLRLAWHGRRQKHPTYQSQCQKQADPCLFFSFFQVTLSFFPFSYSTFSRIIFSCLLYQCTLEKSISGVYFLLFPPTLSDRKQDKHSVSDNHPVIQWDLSQSQI